MPEYKPKELVTLQVADLIPYERNPKTHPESQIQLLANSIREWGWTIPILVDEANTVIAGHGRLYAAKELGITEVPCLIAADWSEEQKSAYVIADNKLAEHGEWDSDLYFSELRAINDAGFNLELIGSDANITFDFEPNLNPITSFSGVGEDDINKAQAEMEKNINNLTAEKSLKGTEVMCPYCAESFIFDGI